MHKRTLALLSAAAMAAAPVTAARPESLGSTVGSVAAGMAAEKVVGGCWRHKLICGGVGIVAGMGALSAYQIRARQRMMRERDATQPGGAPQAGNPYQPYQAR